MWEWLSDNTRAILKGIKFDSRIGDADDIAQETLTYLFHKPSEVAEGIYRDKNLALLRTIIKKVIFTEAAKMNGIKRMALTYYRTISDVCEKYGIEKIPENAYKISGLLGKPFTIPYVISLIESAHQPETYYDDNIGRRKDRE